MLTNTLIPCSGCGVINQRNDRQSYPDGLFRLETYSYSTNCSGGKWRRPSWSGRLPRLVQIGVVESIGCGRRATYLLSRRFAAAIGQGAAYTRRRGLDQEQNKELLLRHVRDGGDQGSPMSELQQVVPALSRDWVKAIMDDRCENRVRLTGSRRWARWFAAWAYGARMPNP